MDRKFARIAALMLALLLALSAFTLAEEAGEAPAEDQIVEQAPAAGETPGEPSDETPDAPSGETPGEPGGEDAADGQDDDDRETGDTADTVEAEDAVVAAEAAEAAVAEVEDELVEEESAEYEAELVEEGAEADSNTDEDEDSFNIFGISVYGQCIYTDMEEAETVPCDGISYDPGKRTLTLDGFSPKRDSDFLAVLYIGFPGFLTAEGSHDESLFEKTMHEPIKIKLLGNNTISASNVQFGIVSFCPLIIEGSGSLNIDVEGIIDYDCFGIIALGGISITGGTVTSYAKATSVEENITPIAAGVVIAKGELELKEKMRLFCGDKAPGEEKTARDFNALMKKAIDGDDPSLFPAYFHTEMIPEEKKEETSAARPAPELPEGKFILTARCKVYKDGNAKGRKLKHKMAFTWNEARNVDGYDLFLKSCKDKNAPFEIAATVMTGNPCKVDLKNLKKHKAYKAYVKPFVINNGVKEYVLEATPRVHFYTAYGNKKGTRLTPTKLTVSEKQRNGITLDIGGKKKIRTTIKVKKGKNGKPVAHVNRRRYYSTNEAVAKVNSKGKVTGVAPGTCKIYILTNNGIYQTVDVTVTEKTAKKKK